jgi:hypothetical protein
MLGDRGCACCSCWRPTAQQSPGKGSVKICIRSSASDRRQDFSKWLSTCVRAFGIGQIFHPWSSPAGFLLQRVRKNPGRFSRRLSGSHSLEALRMVAKFTLLEPKSGLLPAILRTCFDRLKALSSESFKKVLLGSYRLEKTRLVFFRSLFLDLFRRKYKFSLRMLGVELLRLLLLTKPSWAAIVRKKETFAHGTVLQKSEFAAAGQTEGALVAIKRPN